tara:strand:- start:352 stop:639 length:288 start_codon:yes stop_codon:yes gene_type:complete
MLTARTIKINTYIIVRKYLLFISAKKLFFAVMYLTVQIGLIKANYASEVASKECSSSITDRVIYQNALSVDVQAQYFLGNKLFSPLCKSEEQEKG